MFISLGPSEYDPAVDCTPRAHSSCTRSNSYTPFTTPLLSPPFVWTCIGTTCTFQSSSTGQDYQ